MTMNNERKVIELEQGWNFMQKGITKLKNLLEGVPEQQFSSPGALGTNLHRVLSCPDYMLKAEECLKREKERVGHYLHASSEQKLLEKVQHELLTQYETQLLEKEHSGCHTLLRDDKVDDLSRMHRLFCRIPKGLEPVAAIFRQHVTDEGTVLVKQAEDAASTKKAEKKDTVGVQEQAFVRKVIELHDKYLQYVSECFINHSLFHKDKVYCRCT